MLFLHSKQKSLVTLNQVFPKPQTTSFKVAGVQAKIQTELLPTTSQNHLFFSFHITVIRIHILAGLNQCFINIVQFDLFGYKCGNYHDSSVIKCQSIGQTTTEWFQAKADIFHFNFMCFVWA
jgi:hypothetical protein